MNKANPATKHNSKTGVTGRAKQFQLLKSIFGEGDVEKQALPGALFLWGAASSGKSYTLEKALEQTNSQQIKVHSAEILCGRRAFFETILQQLVKGSGMNLATNFKCDSLRSLYTNFVMYFEDSKHKSTHVVILIEAAEDLRGENDDILTFLVKLQDITQAPVCVVFLSVLPPAHFMPSVMDHAIIPIYFPQYSIEELTQILSEQNLPSSKHSKSATCFEFYVKMIVSIFYYVCRDVRKLMRLSRTHWENFQNMVEESQDVNLTRLWKKLEPQLKSQFFEMNSTVVSCVQQSVPPTPTSKTMDMPLNAKYLLIASYLATHNPPSSDKRFFVKSKVGGSKKPRTAVKLDTSSTQQTAKTFELSRLIAIFGSVQQYCDDKAVNKNINISFMNLVSTLCQNKLIQSLGEDTFGNQKYRCLLDYDTVLDISRSVDFEINNYLYRLL